MARPKAPPCPCGRPHYAKGLCRPCRRRERRKDPDVRAAETASRNRWRERHPDRDRAIRSTGRYREGQRNGSIRRKYGLTPEQYADLLERQGGTCAICPRTTPLHVDHDHDTGAVRGILCGPCNRGVGLLGDDPNTLRAAAHYLEAR